MAKTAEEAITGEVLEIFALEKQVQSIEQELAQNERAMTLLQEQRDIQKKIGEFWKAVEARMIGEGVKSIKGDWGTVTIAERLGWITTKELPAKFYKKVVDTTKLTKTFQLEGKEPKGAHVQYTHYIVKRLK